MLKDNKNQKESQNFWISYADLMAGLLFVFILLLGAIVIKYVFIQTDLQAIRTDLQKEKEALGMSEDALADKKRRLEEVQSQLKDAQAQNMHLAFNLSQAQAKIDALGDDLNASMAQQKMLRDDIANKIEQIALNIEEIDKLKDLLLDYELKEKTLATANEALEEKVLKDRRTITLKDEEIAMLESRLLSKSKAHQKLVEELNITKVKIKNLTGIRIKVVKKLRDELGKSIAIDPKSGALRFSSNILFTQNAFTLKEGSKEQLERVLNKYINTLLSDEEIRPYIDRIIIEGHTNSDGTYLYNLELSQKRALAVMNFLLQKYPQNEKMYRKYLSASGRSYADIIMKNGEEDKDASRRIEIKFRIKNEEAIKELQNFLG